MVKLKENINNHNKENAAATRLRITLMMSLVLLHSAFTYGYIFGYTFALTKVVESWFKMQDSSLLARDSYVELYKSTFFNRTRILDVTYSFGATLGSLYTIRSSVRFGKKGSLLMTCFVTIFGSLFCGYAKYFSMPMFIYVGMFLFGFSTGVTTMIAPIYISETAPERQRGLYNGCNSLFFTFGMVVGKLVSDWIGTEKYWPLVMSLTVVPSFIVLFLLPLCPESPKYLYVIKGKELECKRALKWLRGKRYNQDEFQSIRKEFCQYKLIEGGVNFKTIWNNCILRHTFILSMILLTGRQITGVQRIVQKFLVFYGISTYSLLLLYFICNLISLLTLMLISRKTLLVTTFSCTTLLSLVGCILLGVIQGRKNMNLGESNTVNMLILLIFTLYMIAYKIGIGTIGWFIPVEMFTTATVHYGFALGMSTAWFVFSVMKMFYAPLQFHLGFLSLLNIFMMNLALAYISYTMFPNTLNKTVKEIYFSIYLYQQKKRKIVL